MAEEEKTENAPEPAEEPTKSEGTPASEPAPEAPPPEVAPQASQDARNIAMLCHLLGLLTNFFGPLILWLIKKDDDAFIDKQGKEALNFQLTVLIAFVVSLILTLFCIGAFLIPIVLVLDIVFSIVACVKSSKGEDYRYPVSIRLIK
jgi:uncharacterized Tic20 family protein